MVRLNPNHGCGKICKIDDLFVKQFVKNGWLNWVSSVQASTKADLSLAAVLALVCITVVVVDGTCISVRLNTSSLAEDTDDAVADRGAEGAVSGGRDSTKLFRLWGCCC